MADVTTATKRRVSAKGARRAIRTLAEDEESTPQDAFDFMETDHADEVVEEVAVTVVHEIAHHFGISDERLHELGWG